MHQLLEPHKINQQQNRPSWKCWLTSALNDHQHDLVYQKSLPDRNNAKKTRTRHNWSGERCLRLGASMAGCIAKLMGFQVSHLFVGPWPPDEKTQRNSRNYRQKHMIKWRLCWWNNIVWTFPIPHAPRHFWWNLFGTFAAGGTIPRVPRLFRLTETRQCPWQQKQDSPGLKRHERS